MAGISVTATEVYTRTETYAGTTRDGSYRFDDLPEGIYRLDLSFPGYVLHRWANVQVKRGAAAEANVTLRTESICDCIIIGGAKEPQLRERTPTGRRGRIPDPV